jgi:hypothetical protein
MSLPPFAGCLRSQELLSDVRAVEYWLDQKLRSLELEQQRTPTHVLKVFVALTSRLLLRLFLPAAFASC